MEYANLRAALRNGDLINTNEFLDAQPDALSAKITPLGQTALEIAVAYGHENLVKELAERSAPQQDLENQANGYESTMIEAVLVAFHWGQLEMARTLFSALTLTNLTTENGGNGANLCTNAIYTKNFGVALQLINDFPSLVHARDSEGNTPLMALASIPDAFPSSHRNWTIPGQEWIYKYCISVDSNHTQADPWKCVAKVRAPFSYLLSVRASFSDVTSVITRLRLGVKHLCDMKSMHFQLTGLLHRLFEEIDYSDKSKLGGIDIATIRAIQNGILEFVDMGLSVNDDFFFWIADEKSRNVLFHAVLHRQHEIFSRILRDEHGLKKVLACQKDDDGNTLLHMVGMLPDFAKLNRIPGAALQMQKELLWFEEVQKIVPTKVKEATNKQNLTARKFFTETHNSMLKEGKQWTKDTASACSVVGTLIVGIMFAAAITVPGGNIENTGLPFFSKDKLFILFMVSDVLSLFFSSISLLIFLGICVSRYAEEDFQESLPTKMMTALSTLLFSVLTMLIAFSATLLMVLHRQLWIVILIVCLAYYLIPMALADILPFLWELALSTLGIRTMFRMVQHSRVRFRMTSRICRNGDCM